jgi:hypothetical protein
MSWETAWKDEKFDEEAFHYCCDDEKNKKSQRACRKNFESNNYWMRFRRERFFSKFINTSA